MLGSAGTVGTWFREKGPLSAVLVGVMLSSCAAALLIPAGIEFARNLLMTANRNYGSRYSNDMNQMLVRLTTPYVNMGYPGQPGMLPPGGMPGSPYPAVPGPGYPGQPGVMSQGYPGQPGYPGSTTPGSPYGTPPMAGGYLSQPGYPSQPGTGAPYDPNNPYGQSQGGGFPGQPGYPGSTTPGNPYGSPPMAGGYPAQPGQPGYPGSAMPGSPYGSPPMASGYPSHPGYPPQPGTGAPYDPTNPSGPSPSGVVPLQSAYPASTTPGDPPCAAPTPG